jgi:hypothetical protein
LFRFTFEIYSAVCDFQNAGKMQKIANYVTAQRNHSSFDRREEEMMETIREVETVT